MTKMDIISGFPMLNNISDQIYRFWSPFVGKWATFDPFWPLFDPYGTPKSVQYSNMAKMDITSRFPMLNNISDQICSFWSPFVGKWATFDPFCGGGSDVMLGVGIFKNNTFSHQHRIPHAEISQNTKFQLLVPFPRGVIVIGYFVAP